MQEHHIVTVKTQDWAKNNYIYHFLYSRFFQAALWLPIGHDIVVNMQKKICYFSWYYNILNCVITLPNDKYSALDWSKLKPFADDKYIVTETLKLIDKRGKDNVGLVENAFPTLFSNAFFPRVITSWDCVLNN